MSIAPPSKVDFGTQKGTTTSMLQVKPASTAPRYGRVSDPGFTKDETLSEFAAEFKSLVSKMQKSLDLVASRQSADQDGELRSSIEDLVHGVKTILSSFGESNASLADCKRTSARLFAKIDEALRKASEAKRLIDDQQSDRGSDFLQLQPLDAGEFVFRPYCFLNRSLFCVHSLFSLHFIAIYKKLLKSYSGPFQHMGFFSTDICLCSVTVLFLWSSYAPLTLSLP
jgi:hypothetical protein